MMTSTAAQAIAKSFFNVKDQKILYLIGKAAESKAERFVIDPAPNRVKGSFFLDDRLVEFELKGENIGSYFR